MPHLILAIDQGTTSSRAILFDHSGAVKAVAHKEFRQFFPHSGWVEHDPNEIWSSQASVIAEVITSAGITAKEIAAIGITNQRETTIVWDRKTGHPVYHAIVWQDRRTAAMCNDLKQQNLSDFIQSKTGLVIDAYFSATKLQWILDHVPGAREKARKGQLAFGTVDSWLVWKLTQGACHVTDVSNASRTMLFNIYTQRWDDEILELFQIPKSILPKVRPSSEVYGQTSPELFAAKIPISGIAGDQQAALFGQMCLEPGMLKNTYGTGAFMVLNTGKRAIRSQNNLITTIAWQLDDQIHYALEGSIFIAGAVVQWLRDGLRLVHSSSEIERLAQTVPDSGGIYLVPAFAGLGAPHWDPFARGAIFGLERSTSAGHLARAALEGIAFQTLDVLQAMEADSNIVVNELRVDGGAAANDTLMQFQADIAGIPLIRPAILETTALGAAYLAGLAVDFWHDYKDIRQQWRQEKAFIPQMSNDQREHLIAGWHQAVARSKNWLPVAASDEQ